MTWLKGPNGILYSKMQRGRSELRSSAGVYKKQMKGQV